MTFPFQRATNTKPSHCCGCTKNKDCDDNAARLRWEDDGTVPSFVIVLCTTCWPHRNAIFQLSAAGALLPR